MVAKRSLHPQLTATALSQFTNLWLLSGYVSHIPEAVLTEVIIIKFALDAQFPHIISCATCNISQLRVRDSCVCV